MKTRADAGREEKRREDKLGKRGGGVARDETEGEMLRCTNRRIRASGGKHGQKR